MSGDTFVSHAVLAPRENAPEGLPGLEERGYSLVECVRLAVEVQRTEEVQCTRTFQCVEGAQCAEGMWWWVGLRSDGAIKLHTAGDPSGKGTWRTGSHTIMYPEHQPASGDAFAGLFVNRFYRSYVETEAQAAARSAPHRAPASRKPVLDSSLFWETPETGCAWA